MFNYTTDYGVLTDWKGMELKTFYDVHNSRGCYHKGNLQDPQIQPLSNSAMKCLYEDSMLRATDAFADRHYRSVVSTIDNTPISFR